MGDSRIRPVANVLYIDDIDYEDRKKYTCVGVGNGTRKQFITLRVKGRNYISCLIWKFVQ